MNNNKKNHLKTKKKNKSENQNTKKSWKSNSAETERKTNILHNPSRIFFSEQHFYTGSERFGSTMKRLWMLMGQNGLPGCILSCLVRACWWVITPVCARHSLSPVLRERELKEDRVWRGPSENGMEFCD